MAPRSSRRAPRSRRAALLAALIGAVTSSPLLAEDAPEPIALTFTGPEGCPDGAAFEAQVRARTPRFRPVAVGETGRGFNARVTLADSQFVGTLVIEEPGGPPAERTLSGATCVDVVSALALVTALAIDPQAKTTAIAPAAPPPPEPTASASAPPAVPSAPPPPAPAPTPSAPSPPPPRAPSPVVERPPLWLALGPVVASGVTPSALFAPTVAIEGHLDEGTWLAPRLRLAFVAGQDGPDAAGAGFTTFDFTAASLEFCAIPLRSGPFRLAPCAATELGVLRGEGTSLAPGRASGRTWFAADLGARLSLELGPAAALELGASLAFPFTKDTFFLEPSRTVHVVPDAGARVGLGAAIGFE